MTKKIHIIQKNRIIEGADGETILDAALKEKIFYPHSCRAGRCGACKSALLSGEVDLRKPYSRFALTEEERKSGLILACRAVPTSDVDVAWTEDAFTPRRIAGQVVEKKQATPDIVRIFVKLPLKESFLFRPGQYATLKFGGCPARSFSMASLPQDGLIEFHIRHQPGGCASAHVMFNLKNGDSVEITGPFGDAYFREEHPGPVVAVAGGSGLAPMLAIVRKVLAGNSGRTVTLYHGARTEPDLYLVEELENLAGRHPGFFYVPVLSAEPGSRRRTGLVSHALLYDGFTAGSKIYIAGPPPMVDSVVDGVTGLGVRSDDIHADPFYSVSDVTTAHSG